MTLRNTSIALVIMCANSMFAQEIKIKADKLNLGDKMTLVGIGATHLFDGLTTYQGEQKGAREKILPNAIATHPGRLAMYEAGTWALQAWGTKYGIEHGFGKWVRPLNYVSLAFDSAGVFYNLHTIAVQPTKRILIKE